MTPNNLIGISGRLFSIKKNVASFLAIKLMVNRQKRPYFWSWNITRRMAPIVHFLRIEKHLQNFCMLRLICVPVLHMFYHQRKLFWVYFWCGTCKTNIYNTGIMYQQLYFPPNDLLYLSFNTCTIWQTNNNCQLWILFSALVINLKTQQ